MVNRVVVGAHYGLRDWLAQRVTAVVMAVYVTLFLIVLLTLPSLDQASWKAVFSRQWMKLATLLFFVSLFWHAWIGVRDILMDYIGNTGLRLALQVVVILLLVAYLGWSVQILWSV